MEVLKWYDVDTPEFSKIVTSYQEGKATAAEVTLIDVRQPEELVESGKIPGTINIPRKQPGIYTLNNTHLMGTQGM